MYEELVQLDEKIADADRRIQIAFQNHPDCRRIAAVEGVGPLIASIPGDCASDGDGKLGEDRATAKRGPDARSQIRREYWLPTILCVRNLRD